MTLSTSVERRRRFARRALLSMTTILCSGLAGSAWAGDIVPPKIFSTTPGGVNAADGAFTYKQVDLSIGNLELERFHDRTPASPDPDTMFYGLGTSNNFDIFVSPNIVPQSRGANRHIKPIVHIGMGTSGAYFQNSTNNTQDLTSDSGEADESALAYQNGIYTYTDQSGVVYQFNSGVQVAGIRGAGGPPYASQRVGSITYPDGRIRSFSYNGSGQLKLVSDSSGYAIVFDWRSNGLISAACGFNTAHDYVSASSTCTNAALKVSYGYTNGLLSSVTDVTGQVTTYGYATSNSVGTYVSCVTPPNASGCKISNQYTDQTDVTQTLADGSKWQIGFSAVSRDSDYIPSDGDNNAVVTDPNQKTSYYAFTGSTPFSTTDANGTATAYTYTGAVDIYENQNLPPRSAGTFLSEVDLPGGDKYLAENKGPFDAISKQTMVPKPKADRSHSDLPDMVVQYGYTCNSSVPTPSCAKPTSKIDANGNETDSHYTDFGAPDWELQPPPTSGAARPLKLYTYTQKSAYVLDGSGSLVAGPGAIQLPSTETACQTTTAVGPGMPSSPPTCDANAPQVTTSYEYGADGTANNLLLRGKVVTADGQSLRTCYQYDATGNKIAETSPRAGLLTGCQARRTNFPTNIH